MLRILCILATIILMVSSCTGRSKGPVGKNLVKPKESMKEAQEKIVGLGQVISADPGVGRLISTNPVVIKIAEGDRGPRMITVALGEADVNAFDPAGKLMSQTTYVVVTNDLLLKLQTANMFLADVPGVRVGTIAGKLVISGEVGDKRHLDRIKQLEASQAGDLVNLVTVKDK